MAALWVVHFDRPLTRQNFGYERYDNPEVVALIDTLVKGAYGQLLNYFHASLKLERKERSEGRLKRIYGPGLFYDTHVQAIHPADLRLGNFREPGALPSIAEYPGE